ncbi:hypothetical protein KR009_011524 [Drosophila setifemur]|nr:hypothetical protein KR009_011524 [Drosophila setifemur]
MDKFLQRNPTWKTKTYESIVAGNARKKPTTTTSMSKSQASPLRRPLQEQGDSNKLPTKSHTQCPAENLLARDRQKLHQQPDTLRLAVSKAIDQHRSEFESTQEENKRTAEPMAEPKTPTSYDPQWARLQLDLNSPNAALRLRAIRALNASQATPYNTFDVPHAEQSIITMEERNPKEPPSLLEMLKDVIVYVEVRTGNDNRSEGVKTIIAKMGAQINDRLTRNTTHVVFKDGLLSTYKKASEWNIPIVSILWIEACKVQHKICDPSQFPISNIRKYEYPELYGKIPRVRCMQPDSELNKRQRKIKGTPTSSKDNEPGSASQQNGPSTPTTTPKNDISRFFRALSNKKATDDVVVESPATKLLNRISSGCYTPISSVPASQNIPKGTNGSGDAVLGEKLQAQKTLQFAEQPSSQTSQPSSSSRPRRSTVEPPPTTTPARSNRRRSCAAEIGTQEPRLTRRRSSLLLNQAKESSEAAAAPTMEPRMTRRRSSLHLAGKLPEEVAPRNTIPTIAEELAPVEEGRNSVVMEEIRVTNKTNCMEQSINISLVQSDVSRRVDRRGTLYASECMDITLASVATSTSELRDDDKPNVTTQTSSFAMEEQLTPIFSSTRLPVAKSTGNRRRTIFNMDMNAINESIERINSNHRRSLAMANEAELGECSKVTGKHQEHPQAEEVPTNEPKRRRLFNPNHDMTISPPKSTTKRRSSFSSTTGSVQKRRRSLAYIPTNSSQVIVSKPSKPTLEDAIPPIVEEAPTETFVTPNASEELITTPNVSLPTAEESTEKPKAKQRHRMRTLVHTNMHQEQIVVIHKALRKLRGMRLDPTVTKRTTHVVSLEPRRTLNLLRGLMRGVWIVSYQWLLASMRAGKWVNEEPYELTRFSRAIEICRTERQAFGIHYQCELFRFMDPFYVSSLCRPLQFNNMKELLLLGGATLTENRFKAKYIIGDIRRAEDDRVYLSPFWVLDSITNMQIQRFGKYLMKNAIITPDGIKYSDPKEHEKDLESQLRARRNHDFIDPPLVMNK